LLEAQAGPRGGCRLARPPDRVTIDEIVLAIDPRDPKTECVLRDAYCDPGEFCPFHPYLVEAQERFVSALERTSLADVLAGVSVRPS
jgi:DNA-binding IscR family transcriptional regulator